MAILITGLFIFFASHSIAIFALAWRNRMVQQVGEKVWKMAYALISLIGLILIVKGYGVARLDPVLLYVPPSFMKHITATAMIFVFPMLIATYLPGKIQSTLKHPLLVATKLWALSHLLANGMLADVLLFGSFLAWAVIDRISIKRRVQPAESHGETSATGSVVNDIIAVVGGLAMYAFFVAWAHKAWIGVSPF